MTEAVTAKLKEIRHQLDCNVQIVMRDHPDPEPRILPHVIEIITGHVYERLNELEALLAAPASPVSPSGEWVLVPRDLLERAVAKLQEWPDDAEGQIERARSLEKEIEATLSTAPKPAVEAEPVAGRLVLDDDGGPWKPDDTGHPRHAGDRRDEIELFIRDAFASGCRAAQNRSLTTAVEYANRHAPELRRRLAALYTPPPSATETRNVALREAAKEARDKLAADYGPADGSTRRESYWSDHEVLELCRQIDRVLIDDTEGSEGANG